ncbi:MAG: ABC transporter ATP-binding protein [Bacteroidaceae bacterium]|nr:ABC transporter ATP-binding protein [Bacteroidaceae bacterium]
MSQRGADAQSTFDKVSKNARNISIKRLIFWLWQNSRGTRRQAITNTAIGLLDVACQLLWVLACKHAIDIATGTKEGSLVTTGIVIATLMLIQIASRAASRWIHAVTGNRVRNRMRRDVFARLLRCDWMHLQRHHTGDLINRLEGDVAGITTLMTETIPAAVVAATQLLASFVLLFAMSPWLAVAIFITLPICLALSRIYIKKMRKLNRDVRDSDSRIQSVLQESLQHKELIKSLEQNDSTEQQLTDLQNQLHTQVASRTKFSLGAYTLIQLGFAAGYVIAFMWGVASLRDGIITYGAMAAYLQLVGLIQRPTMDLSRFIPGIVSSLTAAERLYELEDIPIEQQGDAVMLGGTAGVRFNNVTFRYEEGKRKILDNFSFNFAPNSSTAIVGETGAGKTTLIRLLIALINPQSGNIELYNGNECHESSTLTRRNFVYIPQGNSLVSGTIRDNLLMGNPNATDEEMERALHIACAEYVFEQPQGIDTPITERGGGLSEGQAQRIAVARSILRPGSILILDEVTSALDEATEQEMLKRLTQSQIGKTLIFVTHRPAVIDYCTQVLTIEKPKK